MPPEILTRPTLTELVERARALVPPGGPARPDGPAADPRPRRRILGIAGPPGAPPTFDAAGYAALVARLRDAIEPVTRAPLFRRDLDRSIPDAIDVPAGVPLVTEGNDLLLDDGPWAAVRPLLDAAWYLAADETRVERMVARHVEHGKAPEDARDWVLRSDEANARIIETTRDRADLVVLGLPQA